MDYLAVIRVGGGSSHGRADSREKALLLARQYAEKDWGFKPEHALRCEVYDVTGRAGLHWDDTPGTVFDSKSNERIKKLQTITV